MVVLVLCVYTCTARVQQVHNIRTIYVTNWQSGFDAFPGWGFLPLFHSHGPDTSPKMGPWQSSRRIAAVVLQLQGFELFFILLLLPLLHCSSCLAPTTVEPR